jgi:hypothetical protein
MLIPAARRPSTVALCATLAMFAPGCGDSNPAAPTPVAQSESFTGTLQPLGTDFKTFTIAYSQATTDLSVTVTSLTTVANATPVTGITIGLGFGTVSGSTCATQIQAPAAPLNQELFAPNGANAGAYCVQIYDCPTGTANCTSTLAEAVNYAMTVKHY